MIEVEVVDVTPGATYQGTTYDQWVTARVPIGVELELFDSAVKVATESDVGGVYQVLLLAQAKKDSFTEDIQAGIRRTGGNIELIGEITELEVADDYHVAGRYDSLVHITTDGRSVLVSPTAETSSLIDRGEIEIGSLLRVTPYRIDLVEVSERQSLLHGD